MTLQFIKRPFLDTTQLATNIADRLLRIDGVNEQATLLTPSNEKGDAGVYNRTELIRTIEEVIKKAL